MYPDLNENRYNVDVCSDNGAFRSTAIYADPMVIDNPKWDKKLNDLIKNGKIPHFIDANNPDIGLFRAAVNAEELLDCGALDVSYFAECKRDEKFAVYDVKNVDKYDFFVGDSFYADITLWNGVYQVMLRYIGLDCAMHVLETKSDSIKDVITEFMDELVKNDVINVFIRKFPGCTKDHVVITFDEYREAMKRCEKFSATKSSKELLGEIGFLRGVGSVIKKSYDMELPCLMKYNQFMYRGDMLLKLKE